MKILILGCMSVTSFIFGWFTFDIFELKQSYSMLICLSSIYYVSEVLILVQIGIIKFKR